MFSKILVFFLSTIAVLILVFFAWHYFLSIYEVRIIVSQNSDEIKVGDCLSIKAIPVNSFAWALNFRNTKIKLKILNGKSLIQKVENSDKNCIKVLAIKKGNISLVVNTDFSLRSTKLNFTIVE